MRGHKRELSVLRNHIGNYLRLQRTHRACSI